MLHFFEKLKSENEDVKKTFAVVIAGIFTVIIIFFSITVSDPLVVKVKNDPKKDGLPTPFSALSKGLSDSFGEMKSNIASLPIKEMATALLQGKTATSTLTGKIGSDSSHASSTPSIATSTISVATTTKEKVTTTIVKPANTTIPKVKKIETKINIATTTTIIQKTATTTITTTTITGN